MAVKRRKRKAALILAAAVTGALVSGCAGSYEAVSVGTVLTAAQEDVSGQETADSQGLPSLSEKETELAMAPAPAFSDVSDTVYIKGNQVRLRTAPTTADASNIYTVLNNGAALTRTGDSDDWCRVNYQGQTLYVSKTYVSSEPMASSGNQSGAAGISSGTGTVNASKTEVSDGSLITVDAGWLYAD